MKYFGQVVICFTLIVTILDSYAEVVVDDSFGVTTNLNGPNYQITENYGKVAGNNLFHSFETFNLGVQESATFSGSSHIENIITRVTGNQSSTLNGLIRSEIEGANFFFNNPNGIFFGEGFSLDVTGSLYFTTADQLNFSDDISYSTQNIEGSSLSVASPVSFGFVKGTTAGISVNNGITTDFSIKTDNSLSLIAGPINIGSSETDISGRVFASQGTITLVSVDGNNNVPIDVSSFDITENKLADIQVHNQSLVDANTVNMFGKNININNAIVTSGLGQQYGFVATDKQGAIDLHATGIVTLSGLQLTDNFEPGIKVFSELSSTQSVASVSINADSLVVEEAAQLTTKRFGLGAAGDINITSKSIDIFDAGQINNFNYVQGVGGDLTLNTENLTVDGGMDSRNAGLSTSSRGIGDGGKLNINTTNLIIKNGGEIKTTSRSVGRNGDMLINAERIIVSAGESLLGNPDDSNGGIILDNVIAGQSGNLSIHTSELVLEDGGVISSTMAGKGNSGNIVIDAKRSIDIFGDNSGVFSRIQDPTLFHLDGFAKNFLGPTGDFETLQGFLMQAAQLPAPPDIDQVLTLLSEGGNIPSVDIENPGAAGNIAIVTPKLLMSDKSRIDSTTLTDGSGGDIDLTISEITLTDGAVIRSLSGAVSTATGELNVGDGNAGKIKISSNLLNITGTALNGSPSGILTQTRGVGAGGNIGITTDDLAISSGGRIGADTGGDGDAGIVTIAGKNISLSDGGLISSDSGITVVGVDLLGRGKGGEIDIQSDTIEISGAGSAISTTSAGSGDAGSITITATERFDNLGGQVTTAASTADGGDINIHAKSLFIDQGEIVTAVQSGVGEGGNINIDGDINRGNIDPAVVGIEKPKVDFIVLKEGRIVANAFGGNGGNIQIVAGQFVVTSSSVVSASSAKAVDGEITIQAIEIDVTDMTHLSDNYVDHSNLLNSDCGRARDASTFVQAGIDGLPADHDDYALSFGDFDDEQENIFAWKDDGIIHENLQLSSLIVAQSGCVAQL